MYVYICIYMYVNTIYIYIYICICIFLDEGRGRAAVVVAEDLERLADAGQAELEVGRGDLLFVVVVVHRCVMLACCLYCLCFTSSYSCNENVLNPKSTHVLVCSD